MIKYPRDKKPQSFIIIKATPELGKLPEFQIFKAKILDFFGQFISGLVSFFDLPSA